MASTAQRQQKKKAANAQAGLCKTCGGTPKAGCDYCDGCLKTSADRVGRTRETRKALGLTVRGTPRKYKLKAA